MVMAVTKSRVITIPEQEDLPVLETVVLLLQENILRQFFKPPLSFHHFFNKVLFLRSCKF